jgi:acetoin utilization deacetylase AcuC-like enzyme
MNMRVKHLEEESLYHYQMLKKLPQKEELEKMERKELEAVLKKLRKGEEIIRIILNDEDVNEFMQQHINQTIIRIKTLGNEVTPENVSENIYQQQVLMAYLHDSCLLVYDEYQTYVEALEKQKKSKNL